MDRPGLPFLFTDRPKKHKVGEILLPVNFRYIPFSEKKSKMAQPMRGRATVLFFLSVRKTQTS